MNTLSIRQRKIIYGLLILLLLLPIIWLGRPASGTGPDDDPGGTLAKLRQPEEEGEYGLSEHSLGKVDPTSAAMQLVLLGFRGVAANQLWLQYDHYYETKQWAQMRSTTDTILRLQPHFVKVWDHHGWNLAYNVGADWDDVRDRYYWIKEGAKFIRRGTEVNRNSPELNYEIGRIISWKIGMADEWRFYRRFFNPAGPQYADIPADEKGDPNPMWRGGPDTDLNPDGVDNYVAARRWFLKANNLEARGFEQNRMMQHIFRSYPYRCRLDYAGTLNREGFYGDIAMTAWETGRDEWIGQYGQEEFTAQECLVKLESTEEDYRRLARKSGVGPSVVRATTLRYQNIVNYRYWRTRSRSESKPETAEAHRKLYEGEKKFEEYKLSEARTLLITGLTQFEVVLQQFEDLRAEDLVVEEALWALMLVKKVDDLLERSPAVDLPLTGLWNRHLNGKVPQLQFKFNRLYGGL